MYVTMVESLYIRAGISPGPSQNQSGFPIEVGGKPQNAGGAGEGAGTLVHVSRRLPLLFTR
jgi:hypothetical protein